MAAGDGTGTSGPGRQGRDVRGTGDVGGTGDVRGPGDVRGTGGISGGIPVRLLSSGNDLAALRDKLTSLRQASGNIVTMCGETGCQVSGCQAVVEAVKAELAKQEPTERGLTESVKLRVTGCHGFCEQGPLMVIEPGNIFYRHVSPDDAAEIVSQTIAAGEVIERLLYNYPATGEKIRTEAQVPFYAAQDQVLLGQNRRLDPRSIEDYIATGGYAALASVFTQANPEQVIEEVKASGLRGRGGGGFPTGRKWESCRAAANGQGKYVICNADEGDPGAYMDRSILEGNPHCVLEGMIIGAYAIGASRGFVYVRNEYPQALQHARIAIEHAREHDATLFFR